MSLDYLRGRSMPAYQDVPEVEDPMALTLVVDDPKQGSATEDEVFTAAIRAMFTLYANEDAAVRTSIEAWLNGRIRKIVKRARNKAWDDLATVDPHMVEVTAGNAMVRVFPPMPISTFPEPLRRLQVSGLQLPEGDATVQPASHLEIFIDGSLNMSSGKLVAQTAHAAQLFYMYGAQDQVQAWVTNDFPVTFTRLPNFADLPDIDIAVHDAGFTEVAANSNTTAARYVV